MSLTLVVEGASPTGGRVGSQHKGFTQGSGGKNKVDCFNTNFVLLRDARKGGAPSNATGQLNLRVYAACLSVTLAKGGPNSQGAV